MPTQNPKPIKVRDKVVVGLIGDVCAGKSTVAEIFLRHGAKVYNADNHVHELYRHPEVIESVTKLLGPHVLDKQGHVDRKAVAGLVFKDATLLKRLTEEIIYPRTSASMIKAMDEFRGSDASVLLLDAPTLFESGRDDLCHYILYVTAPLERRLEWAKTRGWNEEELIRRQSKMSHHTIKRRRADEIIENKGSFEDMESQVKSLVFKWTASLK